MLKLVAGIGFVVGVSFVDFRYKFCEFLDRKVEYRAL